MTQYIKSENIKKISSFKDIIQCYADLKILETGVVDNKTLAFIRLSSLLFTQLSSEQDEKLKYPITKLTFYKTVMYFTDYLLASHSTDITKLLDDRVELDDTIMEHIQEEIEDDFVSLKEFFERPTETKINNLVYQRVKTFLNDNFEISLNIMDKSKWDRFLLEAIKEVYHNDENSYHNLTSPTDNYREYTREKEKYIEQVYSLFHRPVFGEDSPYLDKIYTQLDVKDMNENTVTYQSILEWALDNNKRDYRLISAPAGYGKSTLAQKLSNDLLEVGLYPFYVPLKEVNFKRNDNPDDSIEKYLNQYWKFFEYVGEGKIVLILDGLDEIRENMWETAREIVEYIHNGDGYLFDCKIIITGRDEVIDDFISGNQKVKGVEKHLLHLIELDDAKQKELWDTYCVAQKLNIPFSDIKAKTDFNKIPLLLFLLSIVYKENPELIHERITNSVDLYEKVLPAVYYKSYSKAIRGIDLKNDDEFHKYKKCLQIIGTVCALNSTTKVTVGECLKYATLIDFEGEFKEWINIKEDLKRSKLFMIFYIKKEKETSVKNVVLEFYVKSFYEYFAACEFVENYKNNNYSFLQDNFQRVRYSKNLYSFITSKLDKSKSSFFIDYMYDYRHQYFYNYKIIDYRIIDYILEYLCNNNELHSIRCTGNFIFTDDNGYARKQCFYDFSFGNAIITNKTIIKCLFNTGEVNELLFSDSVFNGCEFKNIKDFSSCKIINSSFKNCKFEDVVFSKNKLCQVSFSECSFTNVNFRMVDCYDVIFKRCNTENMLINRSIISDYISYDSVNVTYSYNFEDCDIE